MAEGRFSRWSRLKRKGGADDRDEGRVEEARERRGSAAPTAVVEGLPGGRRVGGATVPPMAPLAADVEEDDDHLTRGVGYDNLIGAEDESGSSLPQPTHAGVAVDGLAEQAAAEDLFAGIEERELTEDEEAAVAGLPPVESLDKDSDFTPFLQSGIPDFIKRKALRVLWRSDPFFNFRDGMNDYDEDYRLIHSMLGEVSSNYKVGRGHLSDEELRKMTPDRARKAFDPDEEEAEATPTTEREAAAEDGDATAASDAAPEDAPDAGATPSERADDADADEAEDDVGDAEDDGLT